MKKDIKKKKCTKCLDMKKISDFSTYKARNGDRKPRAMCKKYAVEHNRAYRKTPLGYAKLRRYRTSDNGKKVSAKANRKFRASPKFRLRRINIYTKYR